MRDELDQALVRDFPNLYRNRHGVMMSTAMCWGFDCGDGWEPLIRECSVQIERLILEQIPDEDCFETIKYRELFHSDEEMEAMLKKSPWIRKNPTWNEENKTYIVNHNPRHRVCASQVKEKWGTLRFYMQGGTEEMHEFIRESEQKSAVTCELCGKLGTIRNQGWVRTLCDEHAEK